MFLLRRKIVLSLVLLLVATLSYTVLYPSYTAAVLKHFVSSVVLVDRQDQFIATIAAEDNNRDQTELGFWSLQKLPDRVANATLALEDKRFWHHPGVDLIAVFRAAWRNISKHRRIEGASTIPMQVIRIQNPVARTYLNKVREAISAILLVLRYDKEDILKHYLTIVPYSNQFHGIAFAAKLYFDKPVDDLSWAEIAFLSAIPKAPTRMNPYKRTGLALTKIRGMRILTELLSKKQINENEFWLAKFELTRLSVKPKPQRHTASLHSIEQLKHKIHQKKVESTDVKIIKSTLDVNLQDWIHGELNKLLLNKFSVKGASNVAAIVLKRENFEVLAWIGSQDYFDHNAGSLDFTQISRSPGSTLKPFIYALALESESITPATILDDLQSTAVGFRNIDYRFLGPMLPRRALANSRNVPVIQLIKKLTIDQTYLFLKNLNLHDQNNPADYYGLGMAIGAMPTTLERLITAYGVLANEGIYQTPVWFLNDKNTEQTQVLKTSTARLITLFLSDPMARLPSFPRMGNVEYPFPVAIKTGTSQGYRDNWTIAYSKKYLVGVWVGRHDLRSMNQMTGSSSAALLIKKIMLELHPNEQNGMNDRAFPLPEGYTPVEICAYTGYKFTVDCKEKVTEWFPQHQLPNTNTASQSVAVDSRNGKLANKLTPDEFVNIRPVVTLPIKYAQWAQQNHLPYHPIKTSMLNTSIADLPMLYRDQQDIYVQITSPSDGELIIRNPELPKKFNTINLQASVLPLVPQVVWYVDGAPFKTVEAPYDVRLVLTPGEHEVQIKLPFRTEVSRKIKITVN